MEDYVNVTIDTYNQTAKEYAENVAGLCPMSELEKFVNYVSSGCVLDVGCGSGVAARNLQEKGLQVYGIDLSRNLLNLARVESPDSKFYFMDMQRIGFPENSFDGIWQVGSLLHLKKEDVPIALNEVNRVLKPQGIMYLAVKEGKGEGNEFDKRYGSLPKYYSYFEKEEINEFLEKSNFEVLENLENRSASNYHKNAPNWLNIFAKKK